MAEFNSDAERLAEEATKLPQFRNVNLRGVKDTVAEILDMIGKVEGIFSTYTRHDISHIDSMLRMLDWLIPPEAKKVMTSVDWLMLVLAIYLHDLGMVVTSAEFYGRMDNEEFVLFLERLKKDPEAKDYLARADTMIEPEKDRFFYQEYVRERHAVRIREWITGQHSRFWLKEFQAISSEIGALLSNLPTRFKENLGVVCQSHHANNLYKTDFYPLAQRYGSHPGEIANVQYAALILRTVDLIHVTKDRTPSVMYKSIRFSDLKSVGEWDKQRGVWSVNMKGREFNPENEDSHVIEVTADFTEERPFFALTEYIAWANQEIRQTKRWADVSQQTSDAKGFGFPWRAIEGDIRVEGNLPRQMRFELDRGRLLDLLVGHTIYNEPTVAVRELLQNAIDAVRFQHHLNSKSPDRPKENDMGRVLINWNPEARSLTVEDNGIGMDLGIIENHLLRVGSSFYDTPQFQSENSDFTPISRFGIGILTCFMVSDNIEIITCRGGVGKRIRMTSVHADYLLKDLLGGDPQLDGLEPNGTRVRLIVRPSVNLEDKTMRDIVRQWIIVPACEVIFSETGKDAQRIGFENAAQALRSIISDEQSETGRNSYDVIEANFTEASGASYDLAFAVRRSYFPERILSVTDSLSVTDTNAFSGVCIEGIRADWHVPGFQSGLWALLSVRGNRRFRTTVSRQSLETDEEYSRVGRLCAKVLFGHVKGEVQRISEFPGSPLSQASTAGRWVYDSLKRAARSELRASLDELYADLPLVVLEYSSSEDSTASRTLKSFTDISSLSEFWTMESRTVDYLGVISRDLGKELNIKSFLGSLAPEQYDPKVNPMVIDPHAFASRLRSSHRIVEVDFSRKHQRTLLRWQKRSHESLQLLAIPRSISRDQFIQFAVEKGLLRLLDGPADLWLTVNLLDQVMVAEVKGDVINIVAVKTRLGMILADGSTMGKMWDAISRALLSSNTLSGDERITLLFGLMSLESFKATATYGYRRKADPEELARLWRSVVNEIKAILTKVGDNRVISSEIDPSMIDGTGWFDASTFWRDWDQPESRLL